MRSRCRLARGEDMGIKWLVGKSCTRISNDGAQFTFEFGEARFVSASLWRILNGGQIRLTSLDHGRRYGLPAPFDAVAEAKDELVGKRVVDVRVTEASADVELLFEDDRTLQFLTDSTGYEAWSFVAPGMYLFACCGGGIASVGGPDSGGSQSAGDDEHG